LQRLDKPGELNDHLKQFARPGDLRLFDLLVKGEIHAVYGPLGKHTAGRGWAYTVQNERVCYQVAVLSNNMLFQLQKIVKKYYIVLQQLPEQEEAARRQKDEEKDENDRHQALDALDRSRQNSVIPDPEVDGEWPALKS
jgi:hypothetical protein